MIVFLKVRVYCAGRIAHKFHIAQETTTTDVGFWITMSRIQG